MQIAKGKYFLSEVISSGSYGKVYANYPYAIKELKLPKIRNDGALSKKEEKLRKILLNEVQILTELNHPNVVKLYEIINEGDFLYLVMEYCEGDLKMLRKNMAFGEKRSIEIMSQVIEGCKQMTRRGVVHRDLKPANILYSEGVFKIADFGMSLCVNNANEQALLQSHVGTPFYMAPQILQHQQYTRKCDIWSLGVIFYQMLFGRLPWEGKNQFLLLTNILSRPLSFPNLISDNTRLLLKGMLTINENNRISWQQLFQHFQILSRKNIPLSKHIFHKNVVSQLIQHQCNTFSFVNFNKDFKELNNEEKKFVYSYVKSLIREEDLFLIKEILQ